MFLVAAVPPSGVPRCLLRSDEVSDGSIAALDVGESEPVLVAVIDGVGHGRLARDASTRVLEGVLEGDARDLASVMARCHRRALSSRGATVGLVLLEPASRELRILGVGDVRIEAQGSAAAIAEGRRSSSWRSNLDTGPPSNRLNTPRSLRSLSGEMRRSSLTMNGVGAARSFAVSSGTVGHNLPPQLFVQTSRLEPAAGLFLCTDGVAQSFGLDGLPPAEAADPSAAVAWIVSHHGIVTDDATAIFLR